MSNKQEATAEVATQEQLKKYQLCRMVLVNAGTNMHVPSNRITAIDPRGGAAVLGDNGVGKTTTLRILPLFFGHLPSQIVAAGHGQEAMIRFVLPTDASAIAFEYQRGSSDGCDLRLAVIRRRSDDPDVPFYRLYRCGFQKELFVGEGRFLSDDETQQKATELGIQTTSKLTTAEYRSVILRTPAVSKEKEKLRRYAVEWSFGPKQLDNLDRVVAAMVKKHINFGDIVQVAVGLVQHDLGLGAERAKLTFKQGKAPIERWLRNREACVDAFRLAPSFSELENDLREHRGAEASYRSFRADVVALKVSRTEESADIKKKLEDLLRSRAAAMEAEKLQGAQLKDAASSLANQASVARNAYEDEDRHAQRFEKEKAAHWERLIQELPGLKGNLKSIEDQVIAAESIQADATGKYRRLETDAQNRTAELLLDLEKSKEPHRIRLGEAFDQIAAAEASALKVCDDEVSARRGEIDEAMEPLLADRGTWEVRKNTPMASADAVAAYEQADQRLREHLEEVSSAQPIASKAESEVESARHAFGHQETAVHHAKGELSMAHGALVEAQERLAPAEGTLLAALRLSADDSWKRNLAKVINPDLLARDDLDPTSIEDTAETLYGWRVNTGVIAAPDWTDDTLARQAVEDAQARINSAAERSRIQNETLEKLASKLKNAELSDQILKGKLAVLLSKTEVLKSQRLAAEQQVLMEKRNASKIADEELAKIRGAIESLKGQRNAMKGEHAAARATVSVAYEKQRADARQLCGEALKSIDANATKLRKDLEETIRRLAEQLNEHLSSSGVDVGRLDSMRGEAKRLRGEIQDREDRQALVDGWKRWLDAGGGTRVETLRSKALESAKKSSEAAQQLTAFNQAAEKAGREHADAARAYERRQNDIADDIKVLTELEESFGDYLAVGQSVIDPRTLVRDLRIAVRNAQSKLSGLEDTINRRTSSLRQSLTAKNNAVKEFVEASLDQMAEASAISRASALCICYKQIGPQVANDVNITLKTLLANIGAFQKAINSFEREVSAFNRRLQEGLTEVRCFERVKDLRLDIVTNFDGLGFYKKLARMDEVVRQNAAEVGRDYTRELPSDETARALGDFMSVLGPEGNVEVNLSSYITLRGSVMDNGQRKEFKRASELENISSEGLTSLVLITLMTALLNTIRGAEPVHVPWVTDEVGKFDPKNFRALMQRLRDNRIDVVTASPELGPTQQAMFAQRYLFEDKGRIREYKPLEVAESVSGEGKQ